MTELSKSEHRKARRVALWVLYALDLTDGEVDHALDACRESMEDIANVDALWAEVGRRVRGVVDNFADVNAAVQGVSPRWKIERMAPVDRNILRLGGWELLLDGVPPLLVINGCVDLGKEFGDKTTPGFVNGLLDQLCKDNGIVIADVKPSSA